MAGWANIRNLRVEIDPPEEIYDGVETLLTVRLRNGRRRLPAFLLETELQGRPALVRMVEPGESACTLTPALFRGRGRHPLPPVRVRSLFPVNFFVRSFLLAPSGEVTVFPAPLPCRGEGRQGRFRDPGERALPERGESGELRRIADYRGGDPLRLIHWKLSARQGELMVKEMSAASGDPVIIDVERLPGSGLEERLGGGAFLVNRLARENRPVGVRLGTKLIAPGSSRGHRLRLLRELALHGQE